MAQTMAYRIKGRFAVAVCLVLQHHQELRANLAAVLDLELTI
jgi:hypothetical protein